MRNRTRAALAWAMQTQRRFVAVVIGAVLALSLAVTIGSGMWTNFGIGLFLGNAQPATPSRTVTGPPTYDPGVARTGDPLGMPRGPLDGPRPTGTTGPTVTATYAPWAPLEAVDREDAQDVAAVFVRRWLAGAGRDQGERAAWQARLNPIASPGFVVDLAKTRLDQIPAAALTDTSAPAVVGDQSNVTATLSTGQLLVVHLTRVSEGWAVRGLITG